MWMYHLIYVLLKPDVVYQEFIVLSLKRSDSIVKTSNPDQCPSPIPEGGDGHCQGFYIQIIVFVQGPRNQETSLRQHVRNAQ